MGHQKVVCPPPLPIRASGQEKDGHLGSPVAQFLGQTKRRQAHIGIFMAIGVEDNGHRTPPVHLIHVGNGLGLPGFFVALPPFAPIPDPAEPQHLKTSLRHGQGFFLALHNQ